MGNATAPVIVGNSGPVEIDTDSARTFGYAVRRRHGTPSAFPLNWRVKPIKTTQVFEFALVDQHPKDVQQTPPSLCLIGTRDSLSRWVVGTVSSVFVSDVASETF